MSQLNPFIRFNDEKCREAMNFYQSLLGGELQFMTAKGTPMEKDMEGKLHLIMHSTLSKDGWQLIGSDMMRDKAKSGDQVGVSLNCDSEDELRKVFAGLKEGGEVFMEPEDMFWDAVYGMVTDKYGVEWMLNFQKNSPKA